MRISAPYQNGGGPAGQIFSVGQDLLFSYVLSFSENQLYQKHVKHRSPGNGQQHLPLPFMQDDHQKYGEQLRDPMASGKDIYIF